MSAFVRLVGLCGFFGDAVGDVDASSRAALTFFGDHSFRGEYWSFQSLTVSAFQKASRLDRRGGVGTLTARFVGDTKRIFDGDAGGGVDGLLDGCFFRGLYSRGGEKRRTARSLFSLSEELVGLEYSLISRLDDVST